MTGMMNVDPAQIDTLAATIATATEAIDAELARLETTAATLAWSGTAKAAYEGAQVQWAAVLVELNAILKESKSIASQSGTLFRQVEREAAAIWS
ncbi:WXG100 family type VII secretion target [Agromyces soli]